jgi:hypothetical protein
VKRQLRHSTHAKNRIFAKSRSALASRDASRAAGRLVAGPGFQRVRHVLICTQILSSFGAVVRMSQSLISENDDCRQDNETEDEFNEAHDFTRLLTVECSASLILHCAI